MINNLISITSGLINFNLLFSDSFKKVLKAKNDELKALDDMHIELSPKDNCSTPSEGLGGIPGSFRKLEVD